MIKQYQQHQAERATQELPALPLDAATTEALCQQLLENPTAERDYLLNLLCESVPPGVDPAAQVKANFLNSLATGEKQCVLIDPPEAIRLLGTMAGGYNLRPLINLLHDEILGSLAADALSQIILIADRFDEVANLAKSNANAQRVLQSWADAEWFTNKPALPATLSGVIYKVDGEINTDDFSPASEAWSRPDIPLHAKSMGVTRFPEGVATIQQFRAQQQRVIFAGDVVGTGSSRKSACNSLLWHIGDDIPYVPNKRKGGIVLGGQIAPIFYNTAEDSGCLPIRCDVSPLKTGDEVTVHPADGKIVDKTGQLIAEFTVSTVLQEEMQAGGRVPLIIGMEVTSKARQVLGLGVSEVFTQPSDDSDEQGGYTLAQKIIGKSCQLTGVRPGTTCYPSMSTVGSQDTTGPMTRDEMMELACLGFQADFVMQSFCHTAAYPKSTDLLTHGTLPNFITTRKGVSLRVGDGIIHSWLNRFLVPDKVGTGGDSHTRFPLGISFPAGSGLVAFAAALGKMPLEVPESVLVRFKGELRPGITLRDAVNAIPYFAIQRDLLTVEKKNKKNIFNGRILEIEGLPNLTVEQAFELTDASAERSAAASTIALSTETVSEYLRSNIALMNKIIADGYQDATTLKNRIQEMEDWLSKPQLLEADDNCQYAEILEIDLAEIKEPILACPNDPDDVKLLSEVMNQPLDEVFIGSCMTNIGHFRAAAEILQGEGHVKAQLWICPPTRMDETQLREDGVYAVFGTAGARTEVPGCSLCMGNQARVRDNAVVFSTSTRNFNNRLGTGAQVYLGSAELGALGAQLGRIPTVEEYLTRYQDKVAPKAEEIYRYLDFSKMASYQQ